MKKTLRTLLVSTGLILAHPALAQWTTQSIPLHGGWNALFLEVQPEPSSCEAVFAGLPVESAWAFNRKHEPVQFIQDPANLAPGNPDWLTWMPTNAPAASAVNLFALEARRAYLVKLPANAGSINWNIKGRPVLKPIEWLQGSLNLVGFPVAPSGGPSFQTFFATSAAHAGQPIFRLTPQGQWVKVTQPDSTFLAPGEAYWVGCAAPSTFTGPLSVSTGFRTGLAYGSGQVELNLKLKNSSSNPRAFSITKFTSAPPPAGQPPLAGPVPLAYFQMNLTNQLYGWQSLPSTLEKFDVPPGQEWELRLEVLRNQMAPSPNAQAEYQSLLEVADDAGSRWLVPVTAYGLAGAPAPNGAGGGNGGGGFQAASVADPHAGLWAGMATIDKVSQPAHPTTPLVPTPTDSQAQFRILVHVNEQGQPRLLQKVIQMWKNGTTKPDPMDPGKQVVDVPGRYVLLTDEALTANYSGAALIDGQPVGKRLSSAAFAFKQPIAMAGTFGVGAITCPVPLDYNDVLNPFKHAFHPDHNNLDERFEGTLPEGIEAFTVQRQVEMEFQAQDPNGFQLPGWGDTQLGGKYREVITGIHKSPIHIEGTFRLQRASRVGKLNDQD
jgi:hypothetical protein